MDGTSTTKGRRIVRMLAFAAALALPASASTSALADDSDAFVRTFTDISAPISGTAPAAGAVDVTAITAPVEEADEGTVIGSGMASYYGRKFNGRRTASGERFDMTQMTAAHRTLPFGSRVRVTNPANGKSVVVRINDRGPFHGNRVIDLSRFAAAELGLIARGSGKVQLALLD